MNKTELEMFAEYTIKNGGKWWILEEHEKANIYKSQMFKLVGNNYFGDPPVFQVFNSKGKRIYSTTNLSLAYSFWKNYIEENNKEDVCYKCEYDCKENYEKAQCEEYCEWMRKKKEEVMEIKSCLGCVHCKYTDLFKGDVWFCNPTRQIITKNTGSWLCNNQYYERRVLK